jgi:hypothetical protein
MDPVSLAAAVVGTFLVPFLKEGARSLADAVSRESGTAAAGHAVDVAERLWQRVRSLFTGSDERQALEAFERFPEDLQKRVETMLRQRLEADTQLLSELTGLVTLPAPDGASTGVQVMRAHIAAVIDNRNAHISGGTFIGVNVRGRPPDTPPEQ